MRWSFISRCSLPVLATVLAALLLLLAVLQYRWLGQVSEGERRRLASTMEARARDFARDFDREIATATHTFRTPSADLASAPDAAIASRWDDWRTSAAHPRLVRDVYLVDRARPEPVLRRFDPARRALVDAEWPGSLHRWRDRLMATSREAVGSTPTRLPSDELADVPAVVVPVQVGDVRATTPEESRSVVVALNRAMERLIVLWLDVDEIRRVLLPGLARRYFTPDDIFDYRVRVVARRDPSQVIYESDPAPTKEPRGAPTLDTSVAIFGPRPSELYTFAIGSAGRVRAQVDRPSPSDERAAVNVFSVAAGGAVRTNGATIIWSDVSGRWLLQLVHRTGSLDAAVAGLRRRNMAISSTILALLGASLALMLVATRRAQRLAAQQVEFVASVSHELRTPLSVIRSAGENLADGVVEERDQVARYGTLIADEGRKLGHMVEQVMAFAGLQVGDPDWRRDPVEIAQVVAEAIAGARRVPGIGTAAIETHAEGEPPMVIGDQPALVRAVQNLVENALKYGRRADGPARVDVTFHPVSEATAAWVRIDVADRGPGVAPAERRRIFEPFVRGRAAAATHMAGNGLGLGIVRRIAEGHGGRVDIRDHPEGGAIFTLTLPAAPEAS